MSFSIPGRGNRWRNPAKGMRFSYCDERIADLKARCRAIEHELNVLNAQILDTNQMGAVFKVSVAVAVVDPERCVGCGLCQKQCAVAAIRLNEKATIDPSRCTGCGHCVTECPRHAISFKWSWKQP